MNSPLLDVGIGLALIYLLFALSVTSINELISSVVGLRGKALQNRLKELFKGQASELMKDPLLSTLSSKKSPSYIPPKLFGEAFVKKTKEYVVATGKLREAAEDELEEAKREADKALELLPVELRDFAESLVDGAKEKR